MENSDIAMLSMEPRKQNMTITNNYYLTPLIQSAIGITLDSTNAATASKPNVACVATILK